MAPVHVAIVSRDQPTRLAAARAFDAAPPEWSVSVHDDPPAHADVVVFGADAASGDGIVFDPARPGDVVERVALAVARPGRVVAVTGTGGAGATTLCLHVAGVLARAARTCVVDLDTTWSLADRLGIERRSARTWGDVDDSEHSLRLSALPVPGGFRVLLAPSEANGVAGAAVVERAARCFDRVIVDVPADGFAPVGAGARAAVVVFPPTATGVARARAVLARSPTVRWALVGNRVGPGGDATRRDLEALIGHRVALLLPCTPALRDAEERSELLTAPWSRWLRGVAALARALERC